MKVFLDINLDFLKPDKKEEIKPDEKSSKERFKEIYEKYTKNFNEFFTGSKKENSSKE